MQEVAPNDGSQHPPVSQKEGKVIMNDKYWNDRFESLLAQDLIDVPKDYYDEKILFDDPEQLMEVFSYLEEQNLKNIQSAQDIEQDLDKEKALEIRIHQEIGGEIDTQQAVQKELEDQIIVARQQL